MLGISLRAAAFSLIFVMALQLLSCSVTETEIKAAAHVCTSDCYAGTLHSAHTKEDGCYATQTVACGGQFSIRESIIWKSTSKYIRYYGFYCSNSKCSNYQTASEVQTLIKENGTSNLGDWKYTYTANYYFKDGIEDADHRVGSLGTVTWLAELSPASQIKCPDCGRRASTTSTTVDLDDYMYDWSYVFYCDACNFKKVCRYATDNHPYTLAGDSDDCYMSTHQTKEVEQFVCTRETGKYYERNESGSWVECAPICNKTVTKMELTGSEFSCYLGSDFVIPAKLTLLDGTEKTVSCTYVTGTGDGEFDDAKTNEWQTITVYPPSEYAYSGTAKNKTQASASVKVIMYSEFDVYATSSGGGNIVIGDGTKNRFTVGSAVTIKCEPLTGYHVKSLTGIGVGGNTEQITLATDYYGYSSGEQKKKTGYMSSYIRHTDNKTLYADFVMPSNDMSFYCEYELDRYTVTFDPNEGNWNGNANPVLSVTKYGQAYKNGTAYPENPTRDSYLFAGWYTEKENGEKVTGDRVHNLTKDITLYARWKYVEGDRVVAHEYETAYKRSIPNSVAGFSFDSFTFWRYGEYRKNGYGTVVLRDAVIEDAEDHTVYGHWDANIYNVTLNANGGKFTETDVTAVRDADGTAEFVSQNTAVKEVRFHMGYGYFPEPVRNGYSFAGWIGSETGLMFIPGSIVTEAKDITLYAKWTTEGPDATAFDIANLKICAKDIVNGESYDPEIAIPSTETLLIKGNLSAWYFTWRSAYSNGTTKITSVIAYAARSVSFSSRNAEGANSFANNTTKIEVSVNTYLYADRTEYVTDDGSIKIVIYNAEDKSDAIYYGNTLISVGTMSGLMGAYSYDLTAEVQQLPTSANGNYTIDYSVTYEAVQLK